MVTAKKDSGIRTPAFITVEPRGLLIDGQWVAASTEETLDSINPSTGQLLGRVALANERDVDFAVAAARRALDGPWGRFTPADRQKVILRLADLIERDFADLALMDTLDMGMPMAFGGAYMKSLIGNTFRFAAGQAVAIHGETLSNSLPGQFFTYTLKEPVGVVGAIIPWNGPVFNAAWKIAPVLATGCTLILKCAEQACYSPQRIGELCLEAGIPPGVINVITGYGRIAGQALAAHLDVDKVAFTGSTVTGRKIVEASAGNFKRLTLELGGKSPNIVFADTNIDEAVVGAAMAVFANSGQICSAGSRLFIERSIYDEFVGRVADFAKILRVGNSLDPQTQIGPLVTDVQLRRVVGYLDAGANEGAQAVAGGARLTNDGLGEGYFVPPTVFKNVTNDMTIAREEIFGPVISAIPFDTLEEVAQAANNTTYGLGSGVWTRDLSRAHTLSQKIKAGSVWVNCYQAMDPAVPFGGYKQSGYGLESGPHHLLEYLKTKSVWIKTS